LHKKPVLMCLLQSSRGINLLRLQSTGQISVGTNQTFSCSWTFYVHL